MRDLSDFVEKDPAKELENHFRRRFTARYKHSPVITDGDEGVFEWLQREFGQAKAIAVVDAYLKSNDKFVTENGHAPKFIKHRINALIAAAQLPSTAPSTSRQMTLKLICGCSLCLRDFEWVGPPKEIESKKVCPSCSGKKPAEPRVVPSEGSDW